MEASGSEPHLRRLEAACLVLVWSLVHHAGADTGCWQLAAQQSTPEAAPRACSITCTRVARQQQRLRAPQVGEATRPPAAHGWVLSVPCVVCSITRLNGAPMLDVTVAEYDPLWRLLKETPVQLRGAVFNPHDFALTPNFFCFFQVAPPCLPRPAQTALVQCLPWLPPALLPPHLLLDLGGHGQHAPAEMDGHRGLPAAHQHDPPAGSA